MNVAGYIRVSTAEQAVHGLSIDAQRRFIEMWAEKDSDVNLIGIYADEGVSARKQASKRKELCRLLEDVKAGKIDMIVFTKLDRWTRNVREYHKCQEVLESRNVPWKALQEDYETQTASGRLKVNIMLSVAEEEADRTSERIKAINEMKRAKGIPLTGQVPFGYKIVDKKIVKDDHAPIVENVIKIFMETGSIYQAMDKCGYPRMTRKIADNILRLSAYYGDYWGMKGICPPYISKEEYDTIQRMRGGYSRRPKKNRVYMFAGLIGCAVCGHRMCGTLSRGYCYYRCPSHNDDRICPNNKSISELKLEKFLIDNLDEEMQKFSTTIVNTDNSEKIDKLHNKKQRIIDLYIAGMISIDQVKKESSIIDKTIEELETTHHDYSDLLNTDWKSMYIVLTKEERKAFWRKIIKEIRIDGLGNINFYLL